MANTPQKNQTSVKTMDKCENNICKTVLMAGRETCAWEDLLKEFIKWCKKLNIRCFTRGTDPIPTKARTDEFNLKNTLRGETFAILRGRLEQVMFLVIH